MDLDPDTINPDPHPWVRGVNTKKTMKTIRLSESKKKG